MVKYTSDNRLYQYIHKNIYNILFKGLMCVICYDELLKMTP
jgi:hypothetical protein